MAGWLEISKNVNYLQYAMVNKNLNEYKTKTKQVETYEMDIYPPTFKMVY